MFTRVSSQWLHIIPVVSLSAIASGGTTILVDRLDDAPAVDPMVGPDSDAITPGDQISLRSAIQHINTLPASGSYTIDLDQSEIYTLSVQGHGEQFAATGDLDVRRNLTIRAVNVSARVRADSLGDRVFDVVEQVRFRLEAVGIGGGTAVPGNEGVETGGGIRSVHGSAIELVSSSLVLECTATGGASAHGGGIDAGGDLLLQTGMIGAVGPIQCSADGDGGGIRVAGNFVASGRITIGGCTAGGDGGGIHASGRVDIIGQSDTFPIEFFQNTAGGSGGGIYLAPDAGLMTGAFLSFRLGIAGKSGGAMALASPATISDVHSEINRARHGGSVWVADETTFERVLIRLEDATERGGAAYVAAGGRLSLIDTDIEDNIAALGGGSVMVEAGGALEAYRSTMHDGFVSQRGANIENHGSVRLRASRVISGRFNGSGQGEGGGVYNTGSLVTINSLLAYNGFQSQQGGVVFNTGDVYLVHCNLNNNVGANGAAMYNEGMIEVSHSIFAMNTRPAVAGVPIVSFGWNLDADGTAGLLGPGDQSGTLGTPIDPMFGPFIFPSAEAWPVMPLSPCLDAGDASASVDEFGDPILDDFSGNQRPIGTLDIGMNETCTPDLAMPFGAINFFDISRFLEAWAIGSPDADFAQPAGVLNFFDIAVFIARYNTGC